MLPARVGGQRYHMTIRETQQAQPQYATVQHRTADPTAENRRLQTKVAEFGTVIRDAHREPERAEREYRAMKEELLKFKSRTGKTTEGA
jgi:hypothetical protein